MGVKIKVFFIMLCLVFVFQYSGTEISNAKYAEESMDYFVYLPLVSRAKVPTYLTNGNFEAGQVAWVQYSDHGWQLILPSSNLPLAPHGGNWATWLGGELDDMSFIDQEIIIPADKYVLQYWHYAASEDFCGYDYAGVAVIDSKDKVTAVDAFWLCDDTNTNGWVKRKVNLSAYKNQVVDLVFLTETDSVLNSNWFIDDVEFKASGRSTQQEQLSPPASGPKPDVDREPLPEEVSKSVFGLLK